MRDGVAPSCPICGDAQAAPVLEIRDLPIFCCVLFDSFEDASAAPRGDLSLVFCRGCGHLYNAAFDPALVDYARVDYENALHFSPLFQAFARDLARHLVTKYDIRGKCVLEIGCGDGDFLELVCRAGRNRGVGFDPSRPDERRTSAAGEDMTIIGDYFSEAAAPEDAALVINRHVLEHLDQPADLLAMLRRSLGARTDAAVYTEVPSTSFMLSQSAVWDLIYEHVSYFTPGSLRSIFTRCGFDVRDVGHSYGHQYLWLEAAPALQEPAEGAGAPGLDDNLEDEVLSFGDRYRRKVESWRDRLRSLQQAGAKVALWGAGSKGVTFLNILRTEGTVSHAVDVNPHKHGKFIPGSGQQVVAPEALIEHRPDAVILLNRLYRQEIADRLSSLGVSAEVVAD